MEVTKLKLLIGEKRIAQKVKETASLLSEDYRDLDLVILMVLKGAICFAADLIREIQLPFDLQTVECSSYGARGIQRGDLSLIGADRLQIEKRDVLIVDDIFDSGRTMSVLVERLQTYQPRSVKSCVLLDKEEAEKATSYRPDYILFPIPNLFVVGYGLDYKEQYRGLPAVYILELE